MRHGGSVRLQRWVANPLDRLAFALRVPPRGDALLETVGRRTGRRRVTPVCDALDGDTFWIVAQRGRDTEYVRNIEADPRVRVRSGRRSSGWRAGTAHIVDDDPAERVRTLSRDDRWLALCLQTSNSLTRDPLVVRVDLDR